jgi:hypothetical protein
MRISTPELKVSDRDRASPYQHVGERVLPEEFMEASNPLSEDNEEDEDGSPQNNIFTSF